MAWDGARRPGPPGEARRSPKKDPMIVCHCQEVTDRAIRQAVRKGARNRREVARSCKAGATCGGCRPAIDQILASERSRERRAELSSLAELAPAR